MHYISGGCHCGNISIEMKVSNEPEAYNPRACDCNFCSKHGASYISDRNGTLKIITNEENNLNKYKVGSGIADFLVCNKCGVLVGVIIEAQGKTYGSINSKAACSNVKYGNDQKASPKLLTDIEKINRWKNIWFNDVQLEYGNK
jgi:hypothetical protein